MTDVNPDYSEADPNRFGKMVEQPWERFRSNVAEHQRKSEEQGMEDEADDRWGEFERRLRHLENRIESQGQKIQHMEVTIVGQLASLVAAYQLLAKNSDNYITRQEFDPVRWIAYGSAAVGMILGLTILTARAWGH